MSISNNTTKLQSLMDKINALPEAGVDLPTLTNEGSASDLLSGKQLIDQDGNIVTGTIQTKTSSNLTASGATVTVPAGYYASQATKSVGTATQVTPSISVSSSGLITASSTQSAGYVSAGTKSATKQLTVQAAQTITPSTSNKTIASGRYLTGTQTIKGDANLVASNIKSGVSIFGVSGNYVGTEAENLDEEMTAQDALIASIQSKLDGDVSGTTTLNDVGVFSYSYTGYYGGIVLSEFTFIKGMTFADFVNSKMNTYDGSMHWIIENGLVQHFDDINSDASMFSIATLSNDGISPLSPNEIIQEKQYLLVYKDLGGN